MIGTGNVNDGIKGDNKRLDSTDGPVRPARMINQDHKPGRHARGGNGLHVRDRNQDHTRSRCL